MSTFLSTTFNTVSDVPSNDIRKLRDENLRLREDLAQCQVDKEFVWSLWKKLQVASPDVTEAVALVVEREKEKAEEKDRKVLDILKLKDEKIIELQQALEHQSQELNFMSHKRLECQDELAQRQTEVVRTTEQMSELRRQVEMERAEHIKRHEELLSSIDELTSTCQRLKEELSRSGDDRDRLTAQLETSDEEKRVLTDSMKALSSRLDVVTDKEGKLTELGRKYESQLKKITNELKSKSRELDVARRELRDLWETHHQCEANARQRESIIRQLEELQQNTEKMLRECEGAHIQQTDQQDKINSKIDEELAFFRQKELDQSKKIHSLEEMLRVYEERDGKRHFSTGSEKRLQHQLDCLTQKNEELWDKLQDKNRVIERLSSTPDYNYIAGPEVRSGKRGHTRSKSESGLTEEDAVKRCQQAEAKLEQTEIRLQLKETQLEALKQAHQRRLDRLKNLLTSYKLVREQLKVAEDELGRPPKKRQHKLKRPNKKELQQEDTEAAWNELRYVRNENKNLHVIKMNLEEQVDDMSVKASEDASNIHSLQIEAETLREELRFVRRQGRGSRTTSTPNKQLQEDLSQLHAKLASFQSVVESQQERLEVLSRDNTVLAEEKRTLKFEINTLKKHLHSQQRETNDMRHVISRLKRVARRSQNAQRVQETAYETRVAQRYDEVLKNSMHNLNAVIERRTPSPNHSPALVEEVEERYAADPEQEQEFKSETMSELGSVEYPEPPHSAVSLGELIARRAAKAEVEDHGCQTSPRLMHSTRSARSLPASSVRSRDMGTCTLPYKRRSVKSRVRSMAFTQVSSLRQRLISLQLKVKTLTETRDEMKKEAEELLATCDRLHSQINIADTKLINQRTTIQDLEIKLNSANARILDLGSVVEQSVPKQEADQERRQLEQKLRTALQDLSRRCTEHKQCKSDLSETKDTNTELSNKVSRLERDVAQKRNLLDELRLKLKLAKDTASTDLQMLESKTEEVERIRAISIQNKTTIDSLKNSIKALTKEKKSFEAKYKESQQAASKKEKELSACQAHVQSLQQEMDSLQETAREQLVTLAAQGENAVGVAQAQLVKAHQLIEQFQLFVKNLSDALIAKEEMCRVERQKQVREEKLRAKRECSRKVHSDALNSAKKRAQEILDLSSADIDDLLNSDTDSDSEESYSSYWKRENSRWVKKWEKALSSQNFVTKVTDLFLEKLDDIHNMAR
ncbi:centlein-like isoform X2 [Watersipora subatra]|uniref:centlein-like isoform X2 n=1 Tax=Watersipora subatra TaxID=2589382 RepID=UPI00355B3126